MAAAFEAAYPWEAIPKIAEFIQSAGQNLPEDEYHSPRPGVFIHKSAVIAPSAYIGENVIIGEGRKSGTAPLSAAAPS